MPSPKSLPGLPEDYTSRFFYGDVVTRATDDFFRAHVLRCWAEEDDLGTPPAYLDIDRPLLRGEVGIRNMRTQELLICPESDLVLYHRAFIKGDIIKRSLTSAESAIVLDQVSEVKLEHLGTKQKVDEWILLESLVNHFVVEPGDRVVYNNWLGTIEHVIRRAVIEKHGTNEAYRVFDLGTSMDPGRPLSETRAASNEEGMIMLRNPGRDGDVIVSSEILSIRVAWHLVNQQIPVSSQGDYPEPPRQWTGNKVTELIHFTTGNHRPITLGEGMLFRDESERKKLGITDKVHENKVEFHPSTLISTISSLKIIAARSKLSLRWQDGSTTEAWTSEVVPYHNVDDYETWPGDAVMWKGENNERRPATIQTFNSQQRIAEILYMDTSERETVSALETDPGMTLNYGVGIGNVVILCNDNGATPPEVPSLGQWDLTPNFWVEEDEIVKEAGNLDNIDPSTHSIVGLVPRGDPSGVDWWGEVIGLNLDGTVQVRLANGGLRTVGLKNLYMLSGTPQDMEGWAEMMEDGFDELQEMTAMAGMTPPPGMPMMMGPGMAMMAGMLMQPSSDDEWTDEEGGSGEEMMDDTPQTEPWLNMWQAPDQVQSAEAPKDEMAWEPETDDEERRDAEEAEKILVSSRPTSPENMTSIQVEAGPSRRDEIGWIRFDVLDEAPVDHHFHSIPPPRPARSFLSRVAKEHATLRSSLPENILVRTYENRSDLVRCLIIGPEGTPYANAPFVFDVYLDPSTFPKEPPKVFFHSHTNGNGRCNPNLYEDGKVCLSVLGTWSGEKSESWNPRTSSLLQVFVSISGLVLVRSPYHCEPAYAKLEGTREGRINSRHYSEKAYVLSRSFVRTAIQRPPSGFEDAIKQFYYTRGRLRDVVDHAKRLIQKSEEQGGSEDEDVAELWNADAIGSLTLGAALSLKRTIPSLEKLLEQSA